MSKEKKNYITELTIENIVVYNYQDKMNQI